MLHHPHYLCCLFKMCYNIIYMSQEVYYTEMIYHKSCDIHLFEEMVYLVSFVLKQGIEAVTAY